MQDDDDRAESEIRKRAAWLLAMLAVVAGLFVLLSVTLFKSSGSTSASSTTAVDELPTTVSSVPSSSAATPSGASSSVSTSAAPTSAVPTTGAGSGSGASSSSGSVPKASCPGTKTCTVTGDVTGTMNAINAYRSQHGKKAVPTTTGSTADTCALTEGDTCPSSFVWVRVDDLSGSSVVQGVSGFNSSNDLLDDSAKSFQVGWSYDPGTKTVSCALIRED